MTLDIFIEISLIIALATLIAGIMRLLKQPLIIGYILTGILVSPYFLNLITSQDTIMTFSQIGVALLLFIVGLSLSPKVIKEVGRVSIVTGIGQIIFTSLIGFFIARLLGFSVIVSLYIAIALTFSSTIIIMKLLSDKRDLQALYGKISIGFLIVQDFIAIFILIIVSSFSNKQGLLNIVTTSIANGLFLVGIFLLLVYYLLPKLGNFFAKSQEFLFLFSIGLGLGLASLSHFLGFSIEIGALIAGVALSMTPYNHEISSKMRPLRDFFIILFFILLGSQMVFSDISNYIIPIILFSFFILIGNPLIVMILMGILGYPKRVGFNAGLTVAQISEFSLILIALGVRLNHLTGDILSLVTIIGLITIAGSSYFITYSSRIYSSLSRYLSIFERKHIKLKRKRRTKKCDILLFGYNRVGYDFVQAFKKIKKKFLIIDYNPEAINELSKTGLNCKYGDASDTEFLEELDLEKVKLIVSTIPDLETNLFVIEKTRKINKKAIIITISHSIEEANALYNAGATYVVMPHFLGGSYGAMLVTKYRLNEKKFLKEKNKHLKHLQKRKDLGHEHPKAEGHR
ncbi:MAG: cation:proton antiporter [Candidatus Woesearchaeota archaeon]